MGGMRIEQRVKAAVDEVVAATDPEQVVLFGSVARGTAGAESDIDLLVIGDPGRHADGKQTCARTGDQVDVFVTDRATAERNGSRLPTRRFASVESASTHPTDAVGRPLAAVAG